MTDDELKSLLKTWEAPPAPATLRARVFRRRGWDWLAWLVRGEIRLPVPVAMVLLGLVIFIVYRASLPAGQPPAGSLSDFQQVKELQPRIVRIANETR